MSDPTPTKDKPLHADHETAWVKLKVLGPVIAITIAATALYMRIEAGQSRQEEKTDRLTEAVDELGTQVQRMFVDVVMTRQGQGWIEMARALNRAKYPDLVFPDLPR